MVNLGFFQRHHLRVVKLFIEPERNKTLGESGVWRWGVQSSCGLDQGVKRYTRMGI